MKAAVVQMISTPSVKENCQGIEKYLIQAKEAQVSLMVLPENFAFMGYKDHDKLAIAEALGAGEIQALLSHYAKTYQLWIVAGTMPLRGRAERVKSSCLVFDDRGVRVACYDKIHLFDVCVSPEESYQESLTIEGGQELVVVDTPVGKLGLSVCYDLRFPELYRQLTVQGAELFAVPSAFTAVTGAAHWEVLLRARAIENLSYVLAPNQGGRHGNGRETYGHSIIIDPWGTIVAEQPAGEGMITSVIDLDKLHGLRRQFPCNDHHVLSPSILKMLGIASF